MGLPLLFFLLLVLAAVAPRLLVPKTVSNSAEANMFAANITSKPSMIWTNNKFFLTGSGEQTIVDRYIQGETNFKGADIEAGFACISASSLSPCDDEFFFAVSIQYLESGTSQIIWSANRARPVRNNATLEFTSDGTLALHDADGSHVWSSSSSGRSVAGMLITEIGNLVLFDQRNETVWQSFDHPTDTLVPGQSLLEGTRLAANTSATNMTENQLYIIVRPDGLYAYAGSTPPQLYFSFNYLVPDPKKENDPSNVTFMNGILSISAQSDRYNNSSITLPETESTQYIRLDSDGQLRLYQWSDTNRNWNVFDVLSMQDCAYPIACGEYGVCNAGQCTCPHQENFTSAYFVPVDDEKSNLGCAPITQISCQELQHHKLLTISDMSYFDKNPTVVNATSISDCKQACLKNCSCKAVMFSYHHNDSDGRCDWLTEVFSLKSTQPETIGYNSSAYLKVQLSPSSNKIKVMFIVIGALLGLLPVVVLSHSLFTKEEKERRQDEEFDFDQLPGMPKRFSLAKLNECTEGFSKKLGEGGFGSVFEGKLGEERIAVKRLEGARQGKKEFLTEVETIGSIDHINLVGLIGFCAQKSERLLVYEYMPRGSLDRWIYYRHNNNPLDWCTRCRIILDIAKGLCYLHEQCRRKIAHLDIKPQNILLDDNFNAKVADFGLCKLINRDQSNVVTVMRGTPGYLAPEWLTSRITEKVDVYSFGVVLMEIVSGRKNIDNFQPEEDVQLISLLQEKAQNNQFMDLIDKHGDDLVLHQEEVIQMMKLAMWCLQNDSNQRPSMSTVIKVLEGAVSVETFDAKSIMFVQDNPSTYSSPTQASILSGPR